MKIAAVCDFHYWRRDIGSAVRMDSLCRKLGDICDLTMLCSAPPEGGDPDIIKSLPYPVIGAAELGAIARNLTAPGNPVARAVQHYCEAKEFDAVLMPYFNRFWMIEHVSRRILRIIDTHDCQSQRARSFAQHGLVPTFYIDPVQEGALLDRYDLALAMSDEDHDEFRQMTDIPLVTVPFRLPKRTPQHQGSGHNNTLLFVAAKSPVNDLTLRYLLDEIMPLVRVPTVLNIVGNVTVPENLPRNTQVMQLGRVDDLDAVYARSDLALNPTFAGGGIKTKTLEAIVQGLPVLTSDEGARGLRNLLPDALISNDKESFAYRIGALLDAPQQRAALARQMLDNLAHEDDSSWQNALMHLLHALREGRTA